MIQNNFYSTNDKKKYLRENYSSVKNGASSISSKYLRECLNYDEKQKKLFENLETADKVFENAEKGKNVRIKIDSDGNMTIESAKTVREVQKMIVKIILQKRIFLCESLFFLWYNGKKFFGVIR